MDKLEVVKEVVAAIKNMEFARYDDEALTIEQANSMRDLIAVVIERYYGL